jgi:Protein of unknown function (DUF5661)
MNYTSFDEAAKASTDISGLLRYIFQTLADFNAGKPVSLDFLSRTDVGRFCQALGFKRSRNWAQLTLNEIAPPDPMGPNVVPEAEASAVLQALKLAIEKSWIAPREDREFKPDILNDFLVAPGRFKKVRTLGHLWEFRFALAVELEHGRTRGANISNNHPIITGLIVMAHLTEDRLYYARLWAMETEGETFNNVLEKKPFKDVHEALEEHSQAQKHLHRRIAEKLENA